MNYNIKKYIIIKKYRIYYLVSLFIFKKYLFYKTKTKIKQKKRNKQK